MTNGEQELLAALADELEGRGIGAGVRRREAADLGSRLVAALESGRGRGLSDAALDALLIDIGTALVIVRSEIRRRVVADAEKRERSGMVHRGDVQVIIHGHVKPRR